MSDSVKVPSGPAEVGHLHADVSGGALRASVFGAMDGLVTNIALVAGVGAAGAPARFVILEDAFHGVIDRLRGQFLHRIGFADLLHPAP